MNKNLFLITFEFNYSFIEYAYEWAKGLHLRKIYETKEIKFVDCFLIGLFAALGFLSKYLFIFTVYYVFIYLPLYWARCERAEARAPGIPPGGTSRGYSPGPGGTPGSNSEIRLCRL